MTLSAALISPLLITIATLLPVPSSTAAETQTKFHINTGFSKPVSTIFKLAMEDAFTRLGLTLDFQELIAERAISLASEGIDDGECCRIMEISKFYPNLVMVPVKIIDIDFVAFSANQLPNITNWDDLKPYNVGVVRGWKALEKGLADHPPSEVTRLTSAISMFGMLREKRIDVATISQLMGYQTLADMGLTNVKHHEPALVSRQLYLALHKRHTHLIPELTRVLEQMRNEGILEQYYHQVVDPLMQSVQPASNAETNLAPTPEQWPQ